MKDYYLTVLVIGFGLAGVILYLVRRDHIYIRQGIFWILVAVLSIVFGIWPSLIDIVGGALGVAYPPTLLLLAAIIVLVLKALFSDIALTKVRRDLRRLNQRIALLETSELHARADDSEADDTREGLRSR
ncbi:MAG: DUF2304 domain-containing protein [Pseudomonadota bacterium]|nr:DUF2304 domain-containing protein [Pseudomonadota bacterium]